MTCLEIHSDPAQMKTPLNSSISNVASKKHYVFIRVCHTSSDSTPKILCLVTDTKSRLVLPIPSTFTHFIATTNCFRIHLHSIRNDFKSIRAQVDMRLLSSLSALAQGTALVLITTIKLITLNNCNFFFCLGQRFAMYEEKVIFSTLLRRFRFTYDTAKHGPALPCADMLLKPHHEMPLKITPLVRD